MSKHPSPEQSDRHDAFSVRPLAGADRIRAITDQEEQFRAFDSYPWKKDQTFMLGLAAILGPPSSPTSASATSATTVTVASPTTSSSFVGPTADEFSSSKASKNGLSAPNALSASNTTTSIPTPVPSLASARPLNSPADMAIRARIFYYAQRIGVALDFDAYKAWLARQPPESYQPPDILPEEYKTSSIPALPWQQAAPKLALWVDKTKATMGSSNEEGEGSETMTGEAAPYPQSFSHIIELIKSGKAVPGVRDIPNTVVRDPSVTPFGKMVRPKKPWEKNEPDALQKGKEKENTNTYLDSSFPEAT